MANKPIATPAGYSPVVAVSFSDANAASQIVDTNNPLPVSGPLTQAQLATTSLLTAPPASQAASSTPLAGSQSSSAVLGAFRPQTGREIWLMLSGTWVGTVQILRSADGGLTRLPLSIGGITWATFTDNCNEQIVSETMAGALYYISISLTSGTVSYRLAQ